MVDIVNNRLIQLYNIIWIGYVLQFLVLILGLFVDKSHTFYFYFVFILWIVAMFFDRMQYGVFCRLFVQVYGSIENFRKIQQGLGAKLRNYKNVKVGGYYSFMLDMQFNKTIVILCKELNYMRKGLKVAFFVPILEFIIIILMIWFKVII